MENPEQLGRMALRMKPEDRPHFKESCKKIQEEDVMSKKQKLSSDEQRQTERYKHLQYVLMQRGNLPSIFTYESLVRGIFMGIILLISAIGEFIVSRWTIIPFRLGQAETWLVATTIVILSLEGVSHYLTFLRKRNPQLEDQIFLLFSSIGFLLLMLLIFFTADIRQALFQTNTALSASSSLENTVDSANTFHGGANASFVWLMITLSAAITIIGGIAYHDVKNRILMALAIHKLYSDIGKTETALQSLNNQQADLESQQNSFEARFDHGFLKAQAEQQEAAQTNTAATSNIRDTPQQNNSPQASNRSTMSEKLDSLIVLSPIILIVLALIIFFSFRAYRTSRNDHFSRYVKEYGI